MSDMETTAEERVDVLEAINDGDIGVILPDWFDKLFRDLDRALARIAELEAELSRWQKLAGINAETITMATARIAELEAANIQDQQRLFHLEAVWSEMGDELDRLRKVLKWYGNASIHDLIIDTGKRARATRSAP